MTLRGTTKNAKSAKVRGSTPTLPSAFSRTDADKVPLWSVTTWDKHFNNVDKARQPSVIKYHYYLAADLEPLVVPKGDIKILTTNVTDLWTIEEKVKGCVSEGEVVSIPWGGKPNIQYYKGRFVTSDNRIATSSDLNRLNNKYLYYFMMGNQALIGSYYRGASLKHPEMAKVLEMPIPLPPLPTQQRIVDELDQLCALKKNAGDRLAILGRIAKSQFVEMFGDPVNNSSELPLRKLGDLGIWSSGGTPSRQHPEYFNGTIDWYSAGELNSFELLPSNEKITEDALKNSSAKLWPAGSLLVGMYDTAALKMGTLTKAAASNQACACLIPHEDVNLRWLYAVLSIMRESFLSHRHGCRQKNLSLGMIKGFEIPWAELALQRQYAAFIEQLDKSLFALRETVATLDQLYRAKLQEYFG